MPEVQYNSRDYKKWRNFVLRRDHYKCQLCGSKGTLNVHHIKRKTDYPNLALCKKNGITLCIACHRIVTGHEKVFELLFEQIVTSTLTLDYIKTFFEQLTISRKGIVKEFIKKRLWRKIPEQLIKHLKRIQYQPKPRRVD